MERPWLRVGVIVLLVLLIGFLGVPVAMGSSPMTATNACPRCDIYGGHALLWCCAAVLSLLLIVAPGAPVAKLAGGVYRFRGISLAVLERPPRSP